MFTREGPSLVYMRVIGMKLMLIQLPARYTVFLIWGGNDRFRDFWATALYNLDLKTAISAVDGVAERRGVACEAWLPRR